MRCPYCGHPEHRVFDSRPAREDRAIRRRRECLQCLRRFTTYEEPETPRLMVVKRDGTREAFSIDKVLNGMITACHKRPVPIETLRLAAYEVERSLQTDFEDEAPSWAIGERVMERLRSIDPVAYVRFASVYREFQSPSDFVQIVQTVPAGSDH
ncbi:MAG: transcriptional regulator NrdR [Fimbriimonadales bacterium]